MQKLALSQIRAHQVAAGHIALWWLGQSGFIVKGPAGTVLAIDPYLSDACAKIGEEAGIIMNRQVPPPMEARDLAEVDGILLAHSPSPTIVSRSACCEPISPFTEWPIATAS